MKPDVATVFPLCSSGFESDPKEGQERALNKEKASDRTSSHESHRIGPCCTAKNIVCLYRTVCVDRTCGSLCSYMHKRVALNSECDILFKFYQFSMFKDLFFSWLSHVKNTNMFSNESGFQDA